ncbi:MAG: hypothetical protein FJW19_06235 [Actinobacteria bacterium]|nr:hypothetical protein [Actinomycetota bacterium]
MDSKVAQNEQRFAASVSSTTQSCTTRHAIFSECPHCGSALHAEHAHFKCSGCGWRDSCCD